MKTKCSPFLAAITAANLLCAICAGAAASAPILGIFMADAHDGKGQVPFQTDGTSAGTTKVALPYRPQSSFEFHPTLYSITIFSYAGQAGSYNLDFLNRNGVVTTWNGCAGCGIHNLYQVGTDLYFVASPFGKADAVYHTSGSIASTVKDCDISTSCGLPDGQVLSDIFPYKDGILYSFVDFGGKVKIYRIVNKKFVLQFSATTDERTFNDLKWDSEVGNQIIFAHKTISRGSELWATDGTQAGRHLVKSFYGGQTSGLNPNPSIPTQVLKIGGKALVIAQDPSHGTGLWLTDATTAGTTRLTVSRDDAFGIYQNYKSLSQIIGSKLYFITNDIDQSRFYGLGESLYVIDAGVSPTPSLLKIMYQNHEVVIPPGSNFVTTPSGWLYTPGIQVGTPTCQITIGGNRPNFTDGCDEKLYRYNLSTEVVELVANPYNNDKNCTVGCDQILNLTAVGNNVLFSASDRRYIHDGGGTDNPQPWFSKGSLASSMKLKDLASYLDGGSQPYMFQAMP